MSKILINTELKDLKLLKRGKVRDLYDVGEYLLFIATDRISAFDVIMNQPIPEKGSILTKISVFWFKNTTHIVPNHFISDDPSEYPEECKKYSEILEGRSMLVRKCKPLPVECVVRGYLAGSGWKEYKEKKTVCGIRLPNGLSEFSKIPAPIFTPSTKAESGHDLNITFEQMIQLIGEELAEKVSRISIELFNFASEKLEKSNLILADTKFEFGLNENNELLLIDEVLTPDSSRFWLKEHYAPGQPQYNFDKQILRDYLESIDWNKQPPPPVLPDEIIEKTAEKYREALYRIIYS
jgi:phosphoribosylaminoimidazole-succinocarboxamide synthase